MINYEGINYNLETIIQFQSLKLLLETLAKKQIEHNQLFYGQNITLNINPNPLTNNENNKSITEQKPELIKDNADLNFEKIWMEKINNSGLIKVFIDSQKKINEQNNIINELKERINSLEKNKEQKKDNILIKKDKEIFQKKEPEKKIIKDKKIEDNDIKEKQDIKDKDKEKEIKEKEIKDKDKENNIVINKDIEKEKEKENKGENEATIINNEIKNKTPKIIEKVYDQGINSENKIINLYSTANKTYTNNLTNEISELESKINSLKDKLDNIEQSVENNSDLLNSHNTEISQIKEDINKLNIKIEKNKPIIIQKEEPKLEPKEEKIEKEDIDKDKNDLDMNIIEQKIIEILDERLQEFKDSNKVENSSSNFNNISNNNNNDEAIKILNKEKEKIKKDIEKIFKDIKKLNDKNDEIDNRLKDLNVVHDIKRLNEKIKLIDQDLEEVATKNDVKYILAEIDKYEKELSKYKSFMINQKEINNKNRDDIALLKKTTDNLKHNLSTLNNLLENNSLTSLLENLNNMADKFVEKTLYEVSIKDINKKISDLQMDLNEHLRFYKEFMPKIDKILEIKDLDKLQQNVDELMIKCKDISTGKNLDTEEIIKNIKSMESHVKLFMKNLEKERENEKQQQNENCILASRPIGGFKCASCETYIGDIKENNIFLPWNRYHGLERPYRLGSSFSRILQGLNLENNFNPFLQKNYLKSENDKMLQIQNNSLSVKRIRKILPLTYNNSENIKNNKNNESFKLSESSEGHKKKKKMNINLWGIKNLKNIGNDNNTNLMTLNPIFKNRKNNYTSNKNSRNSNDEKPAKITKKNFKNKNNSSSDSQDHLIIPNL